MSRRNGHVKIWQNDKLLYDLTDPNLDTLDGCAGTFSGNNLDGDMHLQFGPYDGGKSDPVRRIYVDDFKVSDVYVDAVTSPTPTPTPTPTPPPTPQTNPIAHRKIDETPGTAASDSAGTKT